MSQLPASFVREGDHLVPRAFTSSGWAAGTLNGRYLAGLVAWGAERHGDPELQPARLTVDMFRPGTMAPTRVDTRVVRDGRRIRVVDSSVVVGDVEICRGTTVFLRRSHEPRGETWFPPEWSVPAPEEVPPTTRRKEGAWACPGTPGDHRVGPAHGTAPGLGPGDPGLRRG